MNLADVVLDRLDGRATDQPESATAGEELVFGDLSTDDVFHILQTKRRRDVLRFLRDASEPVRMRDLAEQVAAWEQNTTVERLSSSERQRVYISLYQSHLPKLDEGGIVEYDKDRGIVERTALAAQFDPFLDETVDTSSEERRDPWPARYAGAVGLGVLVLVSTELEVVSLSGSSAGALALSMVALLTVAHSLAR